MNISEVLTNCCQNFPDKVALVDQQKRNFSFLQLEILSNQYANGFLSLGIQKGDRVLVFLPPSIEFTATTFALFKIRAVPVLIDPGMGIKNLLRAIKKISPSALIAVPIVHFVKILFPKYFSSIKIQLKTGGTLGKIQSLGNLEKFPGEFLVEKTNSQECAAILFTSGGTGIPKGVVYSHNIFKKQMDILAEIFKLTEDDIDLSGFPLFSLFTVGLGIKTIVPQLNPSKPAKCDPKKIIQDIISYQVTYASGSPAIWLKVADFCLENQITLPSLKTLVMFGAPIPSSLHHKFKKIMPQGETYTPYGATEALPVSNISGSEIINFFEKKMLDGSGTCIGKPLLETRIIPISDSVLSSLEELDAFHVGEIVVAGEVVTKEYLAMPEETTKAKIVVNDKTYHRMGDLGYLDQEGYLWFCGRKSHRVGEHLPIPCESIFNCHPEIKRSALIDFWGKPALVIERLDKKVPAGSKKIAFENQLREMARKHAHTQDINLFFYRKNFPVDVRHNIKIDRLLLRDLAIKGKL